MAEKRIDFKITASDQATGVFARVGQSLQNMAKQGRSMGLTGDAGIVGLMRGGGALAIVGAVANALKNINQALDEMEEAGERGFGKLTAKLLENLPFQIGELAVNLQRLRGRWIEFTGLPDIFGDTALLDAKRMEKSAAAVDELQKKLAQLQGRTTAFSDIARLQAQLTRSGAGPEAFRVLAQIREQTVTNAQGGARQGMQGILATLLQEGLAPGDLAGQQALARLQVFNKFRPIEQQLDKILKTEGISEQQRQQALRLKTGLTGIKGKQLEEAGLGKETFSGGLAASLTGRFLSGVGAAGAENAPMQTAKHTKELVELTRKLVALVTGAGEGGKSIFSLN